MIYELKQYTPHPGKAQALQARFMQHTLPIFRRLGFQVVLTATPQDDGTELWYVLAFPDEAARAAAWAAFGADAEWREVKARTELDGPLLASQKTQVLEALPPAAGG